MPETNIKPSYACEWKGCDKVWPNFNAIVSHIRTHIGSVDNINHKLPKHNQCFWGKCSQTVDCYRDLVIHVREHLGGPAFVACPACPSLFTYPWDLTRHQRMFHEKDKLPPPANPDPGLGRRNVRRKTLAKPVDYHQSSSDEASKSDNTVSTRARGRPKKKKTIKREAMAAAEAERNRSAERRKSLRLNRTDSVDSGSPGPSTLVELNLRSSTRTYEKTAVIQGNGNPVSTDALFSTQVDNLLAACTAAIADPPAHQVQTLGGTTSSLGTQTPANCRVSFLSSTSKSQKSSQSAPVSTQTSRNNSIIGQKTPRTNVLTTSGTPATTPGRKGPSPSVPELYDALMARLLSLADRKSLILVTTQHSTPSLRQFLDKLSLETAEIKTYLTQIRQAYDCFEPLLEPLQQMTPTFLAVRFIKQLGRIIEGEEEKMDECERRADEDPMIEVDKEEGKIWSWKCLERVREESGNMINCFLSIAGLLPSGSDFGVKERLSDIAFHPNEVYTISAEVDAGRHEEHDGKTEEPEERDEKCEIAQIEAESKKRRPVTRSSTGATVSTGGGRKRLRRI